MQNLYCNSSFFILITCVFVNFFLDQSVQLKVYQSVHLYKMHFLISFIFLSWLFYSISFISSLYHLLPLTYFQFTLLLFYSFLSWGGQIFFTPLQLQPTNPDVLCHFYLVQSILYFLCDFFLDPWVLSFFSCFFFFFFDP